jgi:hypothetical protein
MRALRPLVLLLCVPVVACGWSLRSLRWNLPDDTVLRYSFESVHELSTSLEQVPPVLEAEALDELTEALGAETFEIRGELERYKAQYFDDGTAGVVVRVVSASGGQRTPEGLKGLDAEGLLGKSVALRTFSSGEVFETLGFEHFTGFGRFGGLFADVFSQLNVRLPVALPDPGAEITVRSSVPYRVDKFTLVRQTMDLAYTRVGEPAACLLGNACVELQYRGTVSELGGNRDPSRFTEIEGEGEITGRMLFAADKGDFQDHSYEVQMTRTIRTFEGPYDPDEGEEGVVRAVIHQTDHNTTTLRRVL